MRVTQSCYEVSFLALALVKASTRKANIVRERGRDEEEQNQALDNTI